MGLNIQAETPIHILDGPVSRKKLCANDITDFFNKNEIDWIAVVPQESNLIYESSLILVPNRDLFHKKGYVLDKIAEISKVGLYSDKLENKFVYLIGGVNIIELLLSKEHDDLQRNLRDIGFTNEKYNSVFYGFKISIKTYGQVCDAIKKLEKI